jgi:AraC-like DNA-binding protein
MFSDEKLSIRAIWGYGLIVLVVYYSFYLIEPTASEISSQVIALILRAISMFFILMALYEAQRGSKVDLIEKRRKIRSIFIYTVSILVLLTLLVELGMPIKDQQLPKLLQRASMLIINTYFIVSLARLKGNFFGDEKKKSVPSNPELVDKIQNRVIEEKLYQTESLTIGQLAELLNEQEYKVRLTINQILGYRNFTDFINSFRIEEARKTLTESSNDEITILEVAYKVGFNSIGPFNRAFKNITGLTPTEYRKKI